MQFRGLNELLSYVSLVREGKYWMLWIKDLHKYYKSKSGEEHHALKGIDLTLEEKGFIFLLGKSGSGKSTLLNILGGLDTYDCGEIIIKNRHTEDFKSHDYDSFRNTYIGFIFQEFYMVDSFTIGKNISISLELQGYPKKQIKERVSQILQQVGLEGYSNRKPSEISGGQKQRIAVARALIKDPQIILADEPTGNLDSETGKAILEILKELSKEKLVIMVTHDTEYARIYADRIIELKDGIIINDGLSLKQNQSCISEHISENIKTLVHFSKGKHLNQQLIQYLNQILEKNKNSYIVLTDDPNEVTTDNLNLSLNDVKEIDETSITIKQSTNVLELKEARLPSKSAIKLACNNIKMKKFRFIFLNFLFVISLVIFGFATMFSFFDLPTTTYDTFTDNEMTYMGIKNKPIVQCLEEECYEIPVGITEDQYDKFKEDYPSISFTMSTTKDTYFTRMNREDLGYFTNKLDYVTIINDKQMFPLTMGRYPEQVGEVLISDYIVRVMQIFFTHGWRMNADQILGETIDTGEQKYKIVGFVKTDYKKFDHLVNSRVMERFEEANFFQAADIHYKHLYMTQETYDYSIKRIITPAQVGEHTLALKMIQSNDSIESLLIGESRLPTANDELVIPASQAYELFLSTPYNEFNRNDSNLISLIGQRFDMTIQVLDYSKHTPEKVTTPQLGNYVNLPSRNYKIVGIYEDITGSGLIREDSNLGWFGTKQEIEMISKLMIPYESKFNTSSNMVYVKFGDNQIENERFIKQIVNDDFVHITEYSSDLYEVNNLIQDYEGVFYTLSSIIAGSTGLMFFLFITASIHKKQKEIGILRAIGARGIDVSKIYLFEGLVIVLIASFWANTLMIGLVYFANYYFSNELNFNIVLLNYGILNILLVSGFAMLVIMIATFLPIKQITVMKPINAIKRI